MVVQDSFRNDLVSSPLKNNQKHRLKQRFDVQRKLGQGTYGKVQLAVNRETGQEVAVKTIKKNKIETEQDLVRIRREIQIMSSIQHPHITHIYEVFENKDKIVLVMQFASGGELYDYLSEKKVLSDVEARRIFRQIAAAVYYCHKNKICHRDLKLENILLDEKGNAKIADFGLSNVFDDKNLLNTYCGSPLYASPEIVKGVPYYGPEVDCWSMGVLLYTLVYGAMPFDGSNFKKLVTQISEGDYFEPKKKSNASDLIRKLLTVNPSKRATIVDICVDYWVNHGYEHSLLQVAEDMANLTPVRFDLLLALAPEGPPASASQEPPPPLKDNIPDEDEEDEEEDEYNDDTAANSFAFVKGSRASQLSVSSPNLQEAVEEQEDDEEDDDFLPADIAAALQAECGKRLADSSSSFGASLARISSLAHKSKKPRKSDSTAVAAKEASASKTNVAKEVKEPEPVPPAVAENTEKKAEEGQSSDGQKPGPRKDSSVSNKSGEFLRKESLTTDPEEKVLVKKMGRPPGKIVIPKTFDSPQSTPSPKPSGPSLKSLGRSDSKPETVEVPEKSKSPDVKESKEKSQTEDINKNIISSSGAEPENDVKQPNVIISEEKKNLAKGILKKGIAKAKLAERRMSKQSSVDSEVSSPCSTPASTGGTPEPMPSFFKTPKPYSKEEESTSVSSKAEIKLSTSTQSSTSTLKNTVSESSKAPLWDSRDQNDRQLQSKDLNWSAISSTIDSEMSNWREQMEESLRRLSPDDERSSNPSQSFNLSKIEDDKPLVPIARSYKKFTFTKDGACITETKKIYTTPGADGSWTKVEKKTKITTRPGNVEEFEKFRDMHLRSESASLARSDSQSSSGSNDVYDDIFDSWTGDTMMCNMRKMNNMFHKFSRDPFMRRERRRNPFRFFRRTESERNELRQRESSSENEEDVRFEDSNNPVVYGSQGLWQLLRSANRGAPGRITIQHEPVAYSRSVSQDREGAAKCGDWKRSGSRASSGYNTGTRSQSRDRTESPREKVLRFVFESPREEKWGGSSSKRAFSRHHNPRRDSGVGSDGYESEYSVRHSPTDERGLRGFMKSWSKEFMSPPPSAKEQLESLPEARKHRVEQWLDMTTADSPSFEIYSDGRKVSPRASVSSQHSGASSYATMRPSSREYVAYGRSSSDRVADCADFFSSFEERRNRSHSFNKEETPAGAKMRFRHSPVGEERSYLSDGSGGSSAAHRVNFTVPAGGSARYVRHFSQSDSSPPIVQMRVSINRGSPPKGLWEHQEQPREPSPLPGIRTFSTEVQHCIGGESTPDDKQQQKPSGKSSSPYKLPAESSLWDLACMENGNTNNNPNNNNKHDPNNSRPDPQSLSSNGANTPDSLEDLGPQENLPLDEVQVKPLGVLWGEQPPRSESTLSEQVNLQQRCLEKTTSEIGSIWNQKSACHPFELLKNLLSDDGLESFSSAKCVSSSLEADRHITVIDNMERLDGFRKASLMDDLQSPKEVLRQAMKICDSFK